MTKKPRLGRGLDALLGGVEAITVASEEERQKELRSLSVDQISRGRYQPRVDFDADALQDLADSIAGHGVVQPIVVRPMGEGFEIVAGERRWRAAQIAGLHEIPAVVRDLGDQAAAAVGIIENIQRADLNPLEEAHGLQRLIDDFGLTHQQTADAIGRSRAAVSNMLRLLELTEGVKTLLSERQLEMGHARALLALTGDTQLSAARQVVAKQLTVRLTESLVRKLLAASKPADEATPTAIRDPDIRALEQSLSETLGVAVSINHGAKGKGKLQISYNSLDELEGVLMHLRNSSSSYVQD